MSSTHRKPTYDEINSVAVRSAVGSYVVGCVAVLVVLWDAGYGPNIFGLAIFIMLFGTNVSLIVAATISGFVHTFLLEKNLPILLFVRKPVRSR